MNVLVLFFQINWMLETFWKNVNFYWFYRVHRHLHLLQRLFKWPLVTQLKMKNRSIQITQSFSSRPSITRAKNLPKSIIKTDATCFDVSWIFYRPLSQQTYFMFDFTLLINQKMFFSWFRDGQSFRFCRTFLKMRRSSADQVKRCKRFEQITTHL